MVDFGTDLLGRKKMGDAEALGYLRALKESSGVMQPEIRDAIDTAINAVDDRIQRQSTDEFTKRYRQTASFGRMMGDLDKFARDCEALGEKRKETGKY